MKQRTAIARMCMICGRGGRQRLGGVVWVAPALRALGFAWDEHVTLGYAHLACLASAREEKAKEK